MDTTTDRGSVAVVEGGAVLGEVRLQAGMGHSRRLMPAVDFLLRGLEIRPSAVEGFAVTAGPGSFTGLRVGLALRAGAGPGQRPALPRPSAPSTCWRRASPGPRTRWWR